MIDSVQFVPLTAQLAPELLGVINAERAHLATWLGWVDNIHDVGDVLKFINAGVERGSYSLAIVSDGCLVGLASHHPVDVAERSVALGYWIRKEYQGRGLIRRAVKQLVDFAFRDLNLDEVIIRFAEGNARSETIPRALGFTHKTTIIGGETVSGVTRDLHVFTLRRTKSCCDKV